MNKILITGATGNIGIELIRFLSKIETSNQIVAGVRNIEKAKKTFTNVPELAYVHFDFEDSNTFESALNQIDTIFLLRPPHISDVDTYFKPLIESIEKKNIKKVVFLSVQGAEKSKVIPHNKIERLIQNSTLNYIFLRPSYFMQNLTTTLIADIRTKRTIILPAGRAKFNWIDIENIAEIAALLLCKFDEYKNRAIEITGSENENFEKVADIINQTINSPIEYKNVNPFKFFKQKKQDGMQKGMIMVMILLHFLPRFQKEPQIFNFYEQITGKNPTVLKDFIEREKHQFEIQ